MNGSHPRSSETDHPRIDGYAPLRDYACLGDGRTVALVARDGSIDWWPQPQLDSSPIIASLLDPNGGGRVTLAPDEPFTVERGYVPNTNVLCSEYATASGTVRVTEALNVGTAGPLPWAELARRVDGLAGRVTMRWAFEAGDRFGSAAGWTEMAPSGPVVHIGDQMIGIRTHNAGDPVLTPRGVHSTFEIAAGELSVLGFVATDDEPLFLPSPNEIDGRLERTQAVWTTWAEQLSWDGDDRDVVLRSALALKLLIHSQWGSIAAAATTSLPERLGGAKNWDYRFAWVRDLSYSVDALMRCRLHEEVHHAVSWMLNAIRRNGPGMRIFYTLSGDTADAVVECDAPGYRGSRPVRAGNRAAGQLQLGTYGDLFETLWTYVSHGHALGTSVGRLLADLADACCDRWQLPDSGIWELPELRHYTMSKIGCWIALDRAVRLCGAGQIPDAHVGRWSQERDTIRTWVNDNCWSPSKRSYTLCAGSDDLDAAVLLAARGFDRGDRLAATVDAIRRELAPSSDSPLLYRYTGMEQEEGAFLACSYWMVEALVHLGRPAEGRELFRELLDWSTDVGLLTEQATPDGTLLGNLPQALTHLALINAASVLRDAHA